MALLLLSVTALGPAPPPRPATSEVRPLYPGATGRLLFTVPIPSLNFEAPAERIWSISLGDRTYTEGPVIPPVPGGLSGLLGSSRVLRAALPGSPSSGLVGLVAAGPEPESPTFVYLVDAQSPAVIRVASAVAEGIGYGWTPPGEVLVLAPAGLGGVRVVEADPRSQARSFLGTVLSPFVGFPDTTMEVAAIGGSVYVHVPAGDLYRMEVGGARRVLKGWNVEGVSPVGPVLVEDAGPPGKAHRGTLAAWYGRGAPALIGSDVDVVEVLGWSPDGARFAAIASVDGRDGLWVVPVDGSPPVLVVAGSLVGETGEEVGPVAFTDDGSAVFFAYRFGLHAFDLNASRMIEIPNPPGFRNLAPSGAVAWVP